MRIKLSRGKYESINCQVLWVQGSGGGTTEIEIGMVGPESALEEAEVLTVEAIRYARNPAAVPPWGDGVTSGNVIDVLETAHKSTGSDRALGELHEDERELSGVRVYQVSRTLPSDITMRTTVTFPPIVQVLTRVGVIPTPELEHFVQDDRLRKALEISRQPSVSVISENALTSIWRKVRAGALGLHFISRQIIRDPRDEYKAAKEWRYIAELPYRRD